MPRPKRDSNSLTIILEKSVSEVLEQDSKKYGVSKGGYVSQLIMQKHLEIQSMDLLAKLTPDQIQSYLEKKERSE